MHFLGMGAVEEIYGFSKLRAPNDGVIHKEQAFIGDQFRHGDLFHFCHTVSDLLISGGERTGPCGGIFYKGAGIFDTALVGIAHGMGYAGIGDAGHIIHIGQCAVFRFIPSHDGAVSVTHHFYVDAFIVGVRVAVIAPEEGADLHILPGGIQDLIALRGQLYDLAGAKLIFIFIAQLVICKGFKRNSIAQFILADQYRQSSKLISGSDDGIIFC